MFFPYAEFLQTYDNDNSSFTMFDIDRITAEGPSMGFDQDVVGLSQMRGAPPPWSQDPPTLHSRHLMPPVGRRELLGLLCVTPTPSTTSTRSAGQRGLDVLGVDR